MKPHDKPPKKKTPERAHTQRGPGNRPAAVQPGSKEGGKSVAETSETPSKEEIVKNRVDPVTNQDEQDKITNAGEGDIPIAHP